MEALSELSQLSCCGSCLLVWYFDNVSMISILLSLVSISLSILFSWFRVSSCDSVILNVKLRQRYLELPFGVWIDNPNLKEWPLT